MYAYSRLEYEYDMLNNLVENEMQRHKKQALKTISSVAHFEEFGKILAYAWMNSLDDAIKLSEKLNLGKLDFLAINEDFEGFKEEYLSNHEEAQNF